MAEFQIPGLTHRTLITGKTGEGKTTLATWLLSKMPFTQQPFVIVNYKRDALLDSIPRVRELGIRDRVPSAPGLYQIHPKPVADDEIVEQWLNRIWTRGRIGIFFDEIYMVPHGAALSAILTQGRSKRIPCIICTQRPKWLPIFALSESEFFAVFRLRFASDKKTIRESVHNDIDFTLPRFHSYWYDDVQGELFKLKPVPDTDEILDEINERLKPSRLVI